MLALVVERASGQRFGRFVEDNIFAPLGMSDSVIRDSSEPEIPNRALGYARADGGFTLDDDHNLNHIIGSGGMYSSVEDLARWDEALYADTLVRRDTLEEAWSPVRLAGGDEFPYGFGWRLGDYGGLGERVCHSGHWLGFSNFIARYPERRLTVIVLSNIEDFDSEEYAGRIVDLIYPSTLIAGATVVDGTGKPGFTADVRIEDDRIAAVGELEPGPDEPVVDGRGLVLAPGFIDTHSHADTDTFDHRDAVAAVNQGITTTVVGQDGESRLPLGEFFARLETEPTAINMASYTGHGSLRMQVMGDDYTRAATAAEIAGMEALLAEDMATGSLGLSTGLEYDPGIYSTTEEVVALARVAAPQGGRYISHIRSEDRRFWEAVDEILTIGREAAVPVQISHVKLALRSLHGQADRLLATLDEARAAGIDVTADIYPYTYWQSTLTVMFPDRDFEDRQAALFAVEELAAPEDMLIPVFAPDPSLAGKTLAEIAAQRGTDPATTLMDLIREAEALRKARGPDDGGGRGRERHRHEHEGGRHRTPDRLAVHQLLHRRRARRDAPAGVRLLSARSRPLCPRAEGADPGGRRPQDDLPGGSQRRVIRQRGRIEPGRLRRSRALRSRHRGATERRPWSRRPRRPGSRWCGSTVARSFRTVTRAGAPRVACCGATRSVKWIDGGWISEGRLRPIFVGFAIHTGGMGQEHAENRATRHPSHSRGVMSNRGLPPFVIGRDPSGVTSSPGAPYSEEGVKMELKCHDFGRRGIFNLPIASFRDFL